MTHKSAVNFESEVSPAGSLKLQQQFDKSGTITSVYATAYPGEETDVQRYFEVVTDATTRPVLTPANDGDDTAERYLSGDDQNWNMDVSEPFDAGDRVQLRVVNNDGANAYPISAVVGVRFDDGRAADVADAIRRLI